MSMRSTSVSTDKEHIAKNFMRSFIELIENFIDQDAHLDTVYKCLTTLFNVMSVDDRSLVLKKILMHFLKKFPIDFEDITKADEYIEKTLQLWRIFGMCSKTMGRVAILEKIEDTYTGCWQYYKMYAESLIEEGRTDELYKTFKNCMEHCELTNEQVRKIFGQKVMMNVKFPEEVEEDECTMQFMQLRQNDIRKSLAARRRSTLPSAFFKEEFKEPKSYLMKEEFKEPKSSSTKEEFKDPKLILSQRKPLAPSTVSNLIPPKVILSERKPIAPPTIDRSIVRPSPVDDFSVFKDPTIVSGQQNNFTVNPTSPTANVHVPPIDDFTVFRDPTIVSGQRKSFDANANSPTVCGTHLVLKKSVNPSNPMFTSTPDTKRKPQPPLNFDP